MLDGFRLTQKALCSMLAYAMQQNHTTLLGLWVSNLSFHFMNATVYAALSMISLTNALCLLESTATGVM